jgi:hypothetical protein
MGILDIIKEEDNKIVKRPYLKARAGLRMKKELKKSESPS